MTPGKRAGKLGVTEIKTSGFPRKGEAAIWAAMKLKEFYFLLESVLDYCEDAAKTIEGILIENA